MSDLNRQDAKVGLDPIEDERLEKVLFLALGMINPRGASADEITFYLHRLGVDVTIVRVKANLNALVAKGELVHPESRTREGKLRAIIVNRYTRRVN